jgi:hypothetical protein
MGQIKVAKQVKRFYKTDGVVDIDWTVANQTEYKLVRKAMLNGIAPQQIGETLFIEGISYF